MGRFEHNHGGKREGAGRKKIGITKTIKITLSPFEWNLLDFKGSSPSEGIRNIINEWRGHPLTNEDGSPYRE